MIDAFVGKNVVIVPQIHLIQASECGWVEVGEVPVLSL